MPPRDPSKIQLDNPLLIADLIAQLNLIGTVGLLDFAPTVIPVFIVGDRDLQVETVPTLFLQAQVFDGVATNPGAGAVIVDTGALPAGDYDVQLHSSLMVDTGGNNSVAFEHRDAANAVTLTAWFAIAGNTAANGLSATFAFTLAANERFRMVTGAIFTNGLVAGTIMAAIRATP